MEFLDANPGLKSGSNGRKPAEAGSASNVALLKQIWSETARVGVQTRRPREQVWSRLIWGRSGDTDGLPLFDDGSVGVFRVASGLRCPLRSKSGRFIQKSVEQPVHDQGRQNTR